MVRNSTSTQEKIDAQWHVAWSLLTDAQRRDIARECIERDPHIATVVIRENVRRMAVVDLEAA
jgi:predicted Fe-S protein YdhL (DUF1289 family)